MLIIPFNRPIDWRRPPVVTFTLVAVNVLVYLMFQLDDGREWYETKTQYYESGLAAIELPPYREYLQHQGDADDFLRMFGDEVDNSATPWFGYLLFDGAFQRRLADEQVIRPGDPDYRQWRRKRDRFERSLDEMTVWNHGLRPSEHAPATFLTHMFMHGGPMHLIGNMVFLIALGVMVEVGLGSLMMAGLYLLSGLGAAGLFIWFNAASGAPMIGASGAIAGLMGLCAVLYGLRRIRFFYSIGVYFDYVKAPAIVLLVPWLGFEVLKYLLYSDTSNVAYTAHIGGILTGALIGTAVRFGTNAVNEDALDQPQQDEALQRRLAEAHDRLAAVEPDRARALFERLARDYPDHPEVLDGLFRATRFAPASEAYHDTVQRILRLDPADDAAAELMLTVYRDYRERARPKPRLNVSTVRILIELLLRRASPAEAVPLIRTGLKHPDHFPDIANQACRLARGLQREGQRDAARKLYRHLTQRFPGSDAARVAERALRTVGT